MRFRLAVNSYGLGPVFHAGELKEGKGWEDAPALSSESCVKISSLFGSQLLPL